MTLQPQRRTALFLASKGSSRAAPGMSSSSNSTEIGIGIVVVVASSSLSSACMSLPLAKVKTFS